MWAGLAPSGAEAGPSDVSSSRARLEVTLGVGLLSSAYKDTSHCI